MKKWFLIFTLFISFQAFANNAFTNALKNCSDYLQQGQIPYKNEVYDITITLEKTKKNECLYKEKISQGDTFQQLNCKFTMYQIPAIHDSMVKFNEIFKAEIAKNRIFMAKMSTNRQIF